MKYTLQLVFMLCALGLFGQILTPVKWQFEIKEDSISEDATLIFRAKIDAGWHIYAQQLPDGGPVPTSFDFEKSGSFNLVENPVSKSEKISGFDPTFQMEIGWFENEAVFHQRITKEAQDFEVKGQLQFMVCNDHQCLPPASVPFVFHFGETHSSQFAGDNKAKENATSTDSIEKSKDPIANKNSHKKSSLWTIFIAGFIGGLAAILMPCIFPMLPLTVSYFTKQPTKGSAVGKAFFYGLSIIIIYVCLGLLITVVFGANALNALATNGLFNFFFFVLLVVFAASFFGAFELTLPASWGNKLDTKADTGGLIGVFFMAATLALVSFSCTGPIIGTLLVQAATMGQFMGPAIGMLGFAIALSLPFSLFAMFPAWMRALPKSGGWLNNVKIVLGFLEMALALKFLSNVDLAYHWNWFDREVFLVLWIAIFLLLALYLLGKIRFAHDSVQETLSFPRLVLAILSISFCFYLIPGLWGAPLRVVSAFLPPQHTQDFDLYAAQLNNDHVADKTSTLSHKKYSSLFHAPLNLDPFFDYEEGLAYAKKVGKPVLIDFTGHACVNCRKMESTIWPDPQVYRLIAKDFVLIQLYVDDKTILDEEDQTISKLTGKRLTTIGAKWSDLQASEFQANSQPYYVLLSPDEALLAEPIGALYDSEAFADYLKSGLIF